MKLFSSLGSLEIIFVLLIGFIILGPKEIVKAGRKLGKFLHTARTSKWWRGYQETITEIKHLPSKLMHEAQLEEFDFSEAQDKLNSEDKSISEIQNELGTSTWRGNFQYQAPPPAHKKNPPLDINS